MELNQLFLEKEDWQKDTFYEIKKNLIAAKDNRFVRYDNSKEEHLVIVYGKSQVGKTTLILSMIGIKDEFFSEVYDTLRAKVERGNSSTSTAIIYSQSDNDKYGCAVSRINDIGSKSVNYYDKNGMIRKLQEVRHNVEHNNLSKDNVLFIYIPKKYFVQEKSTECISILDLPGVESRNHKEDIHVENLMNKYIPISSVCIIACRSNEIQSLEHLSLPNNMDWKNMEHRFFLVITNSYNDAKTKSYFNKKKSDRKTSFYDYVISSYNYDIKCESILGKNNKTEIYPVDIGDSFNKLCKDEIKNQDDRNEIIETKNKILSDLRQSIIKHKGERLKSALADLRSIVDRYREEDIIDYQYKIETCMKKINTDKKLESDSTDYKEILEDELNKLKERKKFIHNTDSSIHNISCYGFSDTSSQQVISYINENALYKETSDGKYIKDKEEKVYEMLRPVISEYVENKANFIINKVSDVSEVVLYRNISNIILDVDNECDVYCRKKFYPTKNGFFSRKPKVYLTEIKSICQDIENIIKNQLDKLINKYSYELNQIIYNYDQQISVQNSDIKKQEDKINYLKNDIKKLENLIKESNNTIAEIKLRKKKDKETLESYLKIAYNSYIKHREKVIDRINNNRSADEKILLIILLGLIDKDYMKVTGDVSD